VLGRTNFKIADGIDIGTQDVLALGPTALLIHMTNSGTQRAGGGIYERPFINLLATDASGRLANIEYFDEDHEAEALARFDELCGGPAARPAVDLFATVGDPVAAPSVEVLTRQIDVWNARSREGVRACLADDLVVEEHRHAGLGRIEDVDAYVESNVVLWDLAPDQGLSCGWIWSAFASHGGVVTQRREGTLAEGGAFVSEYFTLFIVKHGRIARLELFEIDALETALARFEELSSAGDS
jgi:hypothetical protein